MFSNLGATHPSLMVLLLFNWVSRAAAVDQKHWRWRIDARAARMEGMGMFLPWSSPRLSRDFYLLIHAPRPECHPSFFLQSPLLAWNHNQAWHRQALQNYKIFFQQYFRGGILSPRAHYSISSLTISSGWLYGTKHLVVLF